MPGVTDQDDRVPGLGVPSRLCVHLGHERAGRVDRRQLQLLRLAAHPRRDAVSGEDDGRSLRHVRERVDEDGPAGPQVLDDVRVVDDLLPDVDRWPV